MISGAAHVLRLERAGYVFAREGVMSLVDTRGLVIGVTMTPEPQIIHRQTSRHLQHVAHAGHDQRRTHRSRSARWPV